ncbi:MAG: ethanolamine ammonia-lyase [Ruminococcaceae bacterium]|nr:ethanolamine ammonia-lyase [Oscillospiraceae bacterium]
MTESLLSVGIDIGTSTTQLVLSRLHLQNRANPFSVPDIAISEKEILYRSSVHFTPLSSPIRIDAPAIRAIVDQEYRAAGVEKSEIQTGAVIITGETARKENAAEVVKELSGYAGDFVVATAGPDLEGELAARGAGAAQWAKELNQPLIHIDIGGGTSNFAVFEDGELTDTGCINVGGRLLRLSSTGKLEWRSPVLDGLFQPQVGDTVTLAHMEELAKLLTRALEEAAGKRSRSDLSRRLITNRLPKLPTKTPAFSFSGGVGALMENAHTLPPLTYGDLGVILAKHIRASRLTEGVFRICTDAIRATVIGAGCHATSLSGSTIFHRDVKFPMRGLTVACLTREESAASSNDLSETIRRKLERLRSHDGSPMAALSLDLPEAPDFASLCRLADAIVSAWPQEMPIVTVTRADCAKALGQTLACRLPSPRGIVCLDALRLPPGSSLDIGQPVAGGSALPVVIKTLILSS